MTIVCWFPYYLWSTWQETSAGFKMMLVGMIIFAVVGLLEAINRKVVVSEDGVTATNLLGKTQEYSWQDFEQAAIAPNGQAIAWFKGKRVNFYRNEGDIPALMEFIRNKRKTL
jgi:hypothetical protein